MLNINVPLTLVAVAPIPFIYVVGVRMRELMFPISWVVQGRAAEVATVVEENVTGARVVKSFAAEAQQLEVLALAARRLRWGSIRQIDVRAQYAPAPGSAAAARAWPRSSCTAACWPSTARSPSAPSSPSAPTSCSCRRRSARSGSC